MKKIKLLIPFAILLFAMLVFTGCEDVISNSKANISVTYVFGNGEENVTEVTAPLSYKRPEDPVRRGYKFVGWCTNEELTNFYDFNSIPMLNMTLYAKWTADYEQLLIDAEKTALPFTVKVVSMGHGLLSTQKNLGSGVIIKQENGVLYAVTNSHVVKSANETAPIYLVYDVYGNEYNAKLEYYDVNYDLALVSFIQKKDVKLSVANIEERIPNKDETLICVGAPNGKLNCITFGNAENYASVNINEEQRFSDIDFDVLWLNCYADHGSSGGALVDTELDVVGIMFAIASTTDGKFRFSFAVPAKKLNEFLEIAFSESE